jgi:hypothetical protein
MAKASEGVMADPGLGVWLGVLALAAAWSSGLPLTSEL